jgi:hypothetical protein
MPYKRDVIQYFFYFATFSMKKNLKPLKLKDSTQGQVSYRERLTYYN